MRPENRCARSDHVSWYATLFISVTAEPHQPSPNKRPSQRDGWALKTMPPRPTAQECVRRGRSSTISPGPAKSLGRSLMSHEEPSVSERR